MANECLSATWLNKRGQSDSADTPEVCFGWYTNILKLNCMFPFRLLMQKIIEYHFLKYRVLFYHHHISFSPPKLHFRFYTFLLSPSPFFTVLLFVSFCQVRELYLAREFLICAKELLMMIHTGKVVNLQCLLFYISDTNGESHETNLLGLL